MISFPVLILAFAATAASLAVPLDTELIGRSPDFILEPGSNITRRQSYSTDYTTGSGSVNYSPSSGGAYSVTFSGASDFVVGKGWNPGNASPINFSGSFSATSGTVSLSVYGWTTNPLVEYYVVEDYNSAPVGTLKGTVTSDGGTYNIYESQKNQQPSIQGTSNFVQIKSVRTSPRSSGTVTTANHFNAWKSLGFSLGTYNLQVLATEGYSSASGSVSIQSLSYA